MIKKRFVDAVAQSSNLSKEDTVILRYGLKKIVLLIEDAIFTIVVGWFLGIPALSIVFQIAFMLLRMHAGGYHSKTELQCTIQSAIVTVVSLIGIRMMVEQLWWSSPLFALTGAGIMLLAPVEAENKPLSVKEKKINHGKTIGIILVFFLIAVASRILNLDFFYAIAVAFYAVCILMVLGIIANKYRLHKNTKEK